MNHVLTVGLGVLGAGLVASLPAAAGDMVEKDSAQVETTEEMQEQAEEMQAEETTETTIVDVASSSGEFEILVAAVEAAGLVEVLSGEGPFTVFAPTDAAFEALPEGALEALLMPENQALLAQILTYHVVPGTVTSGDLVEGDVATVEGSDVTVSLGDSVMVNDATVVMPDIEASNGVIHVIDKVIIPPSLLSELDVEKPAL
ncbi:fasciclin domain-containing protein [Pseudanabaena sp. FACHB-2040]|uniref:fasciclin domain-containing protein n=1 Tax=Pseudanabaena sp. FACHB-2040 TaxID=2692859 RepID=UPI001686A6C6|nr:fasciclin domain-containing protein [Pseudanabaena sp. FACHB-2040]MBD2257018.1 fasciclin domain-containing protein [Pseudanabaena sp. FACHB-2040]